MHGGFHPSFVKEKKDLETINSIFTIYIDGDKRPVFAKRLFWRNGPIWCRGYFNKIPINNLDSLLNFYRVEHIIVGHTSFEQDKAVALNKIIAINGSNKRGHKGELFLYQNETRYRGKLNGVTVWLIN